MIPLSLTFVIDHWDDLLNSPSEFHIGLCLRLTTSLSRR